MTISFVSGVPLMLVEKERMLVAGDLHIGIEYGFADRGFYFADSAAKMSEEIMEAVHKSSAKGIILLGDVKDRLMNVTMDDERSLRKFFGGLDGIEVRIAKGNHDGYLAKILERLGIRASVENEILLSGVALLHGNTMPSNDAMKKDFVVTGHAHVAANVNGRDEKVWAVLKAGKGARRVYKEYNKKCKLVMAPAFNSMIIGTAIGKESSTNLPLVRNGVFDIKSLEIYDIWGNKLS
ncbi:MAG: metallophosphoesterase family protein [Candidatus Micrarchaeota archaeon]|nr:metallophosphoesterase family protein [Candidatus Micrarchaeota archaeon]